MNCTRTGSRSSTTHRSSQIGCSCVECLPTLAVNNFLKPVISPRIPFFLLHLSTVWRPVALRHGPADWIRAGRAGGRHSAQGQGRGARVGLGREAARRRGGGKTPSGYGCQGGWMGGGGELSRESLCCCEMHCACVCVVCVCVRARVLCCAGVLWCSVLCSVLQIHFPTRTISI